LLSGSSPLVWYYRSSGLGGLPRAQARRLRPRRAAGVAAGAPREAKEWAGLLKEGYTTADTYILEIEAEVSSDLRLLMFASAAGLDVALNKATPGAGGSGGVG
jgi:hypothetical protein